MKEIVAAAFENAKRILSAHRSVLEEAAGLLLERATLAQADLAGFAARMAKTEGVPDKAA